MTKRSVSVPAGGQPRDYEVLVGRGLLGDLPGLLRERVAVHRWAVIADSTVAALYGRALAAALDGLLLEFPAGESHKTRASWAELTDALLHAGCGRDTGIVALGGGVTGDLAGFVAATFLRGVPIVQVPTSLVAMIDSSVGGKTGVDTGAGKNLVGAFHPPRLVVVDPDFASTLPVRERAQGLVEALKHGAILDEPYFNSLVGLLPVLLAGHPEETEAAVLRSIELKAEVVGRDERESGYREILNFGHTLGHALEAASDYHLTHGEAVAMGMILEARLGERLGVTALGACARIEGAVRSLGLDTRPQGRSDPDAVLAFLSTDKKRRQGQVRCVLLERIGKVDSERGWSRPVDPAELAAALD